MNELEGAFRRHARALQHAKLKQKVRENKTHGRGCMHARRPRTRTSAQHMPQQGMTCRAGMLRGGAAAHFGIYSDAGAGQPIKTKLI